MDTIVNVVGIILIIVFYLGCLSIPAFFGLIFLYIILMIGAAICSALSNLFGKPKSELTYEQLVSWCNNGIREPWLLEKLEAERAELEGTHFICTTCNVERIKKVE